MFCEESNKRRLIRPTRLSRSVCDRVSVKHRFSQKEEITPHAHSTCQHYALPSIAPRYHSAAIATFMQRGPLNGPLNVCNSILNRSIASVTYDAFTNCAVSRRRKCNKLNEIDFGSSEANNLAMKKL